MWIRPVLFALLLIAGSVHAFDAAPKRPIDLGGHWVLNEQTSDDVDELLEQRIERERQRYAKWMREAQAARPPGMPPMDTVDAPPPGRSERMERRRQRQQALFRQMLNISPTLQIAQALPRFELTSEVDSRRYEAGTRTQVSMPEGELADCEAGWEGEWFVIERRVRRGGSVIEKFRLLKKTGQLEYFMHWFGETEIAGLKVRRVFDRASTEADSG